MARKFKSHRFKNLFILTLGITFAIFLSRQPAFHKFLLSLGNLGYIGAFFAGMLFVSTITMTTGMVTLFILAETLMPIEIGILAGLGAVVGDFLIFRLVRDDLVEDIEFIYKEIGGSHLNKVLHTRYFKWTLPVIGAIIVASPMPDEIGISLMGISKMKTYEFIFLSFLLNSIGIFLVVSTQVALK